MAFKGKNERYVPRSLVESVQPEPESIDLTANPETGGAPLKHFPVLDLTAVRRRKVRELRDMGYINSEIASILSRGITIGGKVESFGQVDVQLVKSDLDYIISEDLACDRNLEEKRSEIMAKYNYLYRRAVSEAIDKNNNGRAPFLNIARQILDKIIEVEGISTPGKMDVRMIAVNHNASHLADDAAESLSKEERDEVSRTIRQILENRDAGGTA